MNTASGDPLLQEFRASVSGPDEEIDLARAAAHIARIEYPSLRIEPVLDRMNDLAARVVDRCPAGSHPLSQVEALTQVLLVEEGMRGAQDDYYDPRNSYINDVLDRRLGIPISLSLIYINVGARAGAALGGTAMPMHFLVRVLGVKPPRFVDCYNGGQILGEDDCRRAVQAMSGGQIPFIPEMLELVSNGEILTRMLTNLKLIHQKSLDHARVIPVLDRLRVLNPRSSGFLRERGLAHYRLGDGEAARRDFAEYLASTNNPSDADEIRRLMKQL